MERTYIVRTFGCQMNEHDSERIAGLLEADGLGEMLAETSEHLNDNFGVLFDEMLKQRTDRLSAEPEDAEALVEAVTLYHMVIEGMLALTGQHFIISYNEEQGVLPGFVEGFNNVARDEHRHVAFGARFLREMAQADPKYAEAIQRMLVESAPAADGVLQPPWYEEGMDLFGVSLDETREFAMKALERRLKVIGLAPVTVIVSWTVEMPSCTLTPALKPTVTIMSWLTTVLKPANSNRTE